MKQEIDVRIVKEGRIGFFTALMMLGLVIWMWKFLLLFAVLFVAVVIVVFCGLRYRARQHVRMAILHRCELQHYWATMDMPQGMYGYDMYGDVSSSDWWELHCGTPGPGMHPIFCDLCKSVPAPKSRAPMPKPTSERLRRVVDGDTVVVRRVGGETVERHL